MHSTEETADGLLVRVRPVDRDRPAAGKPLVMTMHRAKGMEFSKVVLADTGYRSGGESARIERLDQSERHDAELRARSLVYTRARDELVVVDRVVPA